MELLGINSVFHEQAAFLLGEKCIVAVEEERLNGIKHGKDSSPYGAWLLPFQSITYCLQKAGLTLDEVDHIAYSYNPWVDLKKNWPAFTKELFKLNLKQLNREIARLYFNFRIKSLIFECAPKCPSIKKFFIPASGSIPQFHYVEHHLAHAASSFFVSPFQKAAIVTIDGIGESTCTLLAFGERTCLKKIKEIKYPYSLGFFYEEITKFLGFQRNNDEHKVMALAAYGKPRYYESLKKIAYPVKDGSYNVNMNFKKTSLFSHPRLREILGARRMWGGEITQHHADIAASAQRLLEDIVLHLLQWLYDITKCENLCLAGGVALNCLLNERIRQESPFKNIFVQPASHDAGTALGAALYVKHMLLGQQRDYTMTHSYLGPSFTNDQIKLKLDQCKLRYHYVKDIEKEAAELLYKGKIVGWFQGRMEWGPRALGNRSILADPRNPKVKEILNKIKNRPQFLPFAPSVLEEKVGEFFEGSEPSPFMLFVRKAKPHTRNIAPAVIHSDGTARIQTVSKQLNLSFYMLIKKFEDISGIPIILNTSLNGPGQPIVCNIEQAINCFYNTGIDSLILGNYLIEKHSDIIQENQLHEKLEAVF